MRRGSAALVVAVMLLLAGAAHASSQAYITRVTGGASEGETLPLVIAVHGLGDRPDRFAHLFDDVTTPIRIVLPQAPIAHGAGYSWFDSAGAELGAPAVAAGVKDAADRVAELAAALPKGLPTKGKPIVTGFSQGGMVSFAVAALHPDAIAMSIPMGGFLPGRIEVAGSAAGAQPRVVALHGSADSRIPPGLARVSVERLKIAGFDARLETFAGVGHGVSPSMRRRFAELIASAAKEATGTAGDSEASAGPPARAPAEQGATKGGESPSQLPAGKLSSGTPGDPDRHESTTP